MGKSLVDRYEEIMREELDSLTHRVSFVTGDVEKAVERNYMKFFKDLLKHEVKALITKATAQRYDIDAANKVKISVSEGWRSVSITIHISDLVDTDPAVKKARQLKDEAINEIKALKTELTEWAKDALIKRLRGATVTIPNLSTHKVEKKIEELTLLAEAIKHG